MIHIAILGILALSLLASGQSGTNTITYHVYGTGQIYGSCDYYSQVSKYAGYITANVLGLPCYACIEMNYGSNTIYVTNVDTGGNVLDVNEPAFIQLCGQNGLNAGHCTVSWQIVSANNCIGNPNAGSSPPPPPPPPPSNPSSSGNQDMRCGSDWESANSNCGTLCSPSDNYYCPSGQSCYNSLDTSPCSGSSNSDPNNSGGGTTTTRCGNGWSDANSQCKADCVDDSACSNGDTCFADLNPCGGQANTDTQSTLSSPSPSSSPLPSWAVALVVVGALAVVGLAVVMVQVVLILRSRLREDV